MADEPRETLRLAAEATRPWMNDDDSGFIFGPDGRALLQSWSKSEEDFTNALNNRRYAVHAANVADDYARRLIANEAELSALRETLRRVGELVEKIVCTEGCDAGVVMLSNDGPTHPEVIDGKTVQVYDHMYFSPLGDALMELYELVRPLTPATPEGATDGRPA